MAETSENTYIAYTYSYTYIIGGKEVKSSVDTAYTTYGIPADVKISYAGDIFVRSSVDPKSYTHGIPVDVLVSNSQTFVQDVAKHIMAAAQNFINSTFQIQQFLRPFRQNLIC